MTCRPRVVVVATHGMFGAPTAEVRLALEGLGYAIEGELLAEDSTPTLLDMCRAQDVRVLFAVRCDGGAPA